MDMQPAGASLQLPRTVLKGYTASSQSFSFSCFPIGRTTTTLIGTWLNARSRNDLTGFEISHQDIQTLRDGLFFYCLDQ